MRPSEAEKSASTLTRRRFLSYSTPGLLALSGCGGGGDASTTEPPASVPPSSSGGDKPDTLAALNSIATQWNALPHASRVDDLQSMFDYVQTLSIVTTASLSEAGSIAARFSNGDSYVYVDNLDVSDVTSPTPMDAARTRALSAPVNQLPEGLSGNALLFNGFSALNYNPLLPVVAGLHLLQVQTMLQSKGYQTTLRSGSVANLYAAVDADVFYFNGHGCDALDKDGKPTIGLLTTDLVLNAGAAVYDLLLGGDLVGYAHLINREPGHFGIFPVYYVTPSFFSAKSRFTQDSFVFLNACCTSPSYQPKKVSAPLVRLSDACFSAGASVCAGWSNEIRETEIIESGAYLFERLLGTDTLYKTTPPTRSFDWPTVLAYMATGKITHTSGNTSLPLSQSLITDTRDVDNAPPTAANLELVQSSLASVDPTAFGVLVPTIASMQVGNSAGSVTLLISGLFGDDPGSTGSVKVGGVAITVRSWTTTTLFCAVPSGGGDVVVTVRGHASDPRRLTEWRGTLDYSDNGADSLNQTLHVNIVVLADVSQTRNAPGDALIGNSPWLRAASFQVVPAATAQYSGSGKWTSQDGKEVVTFSGSGGLQPQRFGTSGTFGYEGTIDPVGGAFALSFSATADGGVTDVYTDSTGQTTTSTGPFSVGSQTAFRNNVDAQGRLHFTIDTTTFTVNGAAFQDMGPEVAVETNPLATIVTLSDLSVVDGTQPVVQPV